MREERFEPTAFDLLTSRTPDDFALPSRFSKRNCSMQLEGERSVLWDYECA